MTRARLPLALDFDGRLAVVIGGGAVATRKVQALLRAGARVLVIAPEVSLELTELADAGTIELRARPYQVGDLADAWLAVVAVDKPDVARVVAGEAEAQRVWLNDATGNDAGACHFLATVPIEGVTLALATDGASPFAARKLRERLQAAVPPELGALTILLGEFRPQVQARVAAPEARRACYEDMWRSPAAERLRLGDRAGARAALIAVLERHADS